MQRLATVKLSTGARLTCSQNINAKIYRFSTSSTSYSSDGSSVPPKKGGAGSKLLIALFGTAALTTGTLVYAKHNDDVRDILRDYAPWADSTIAIMYAEKDAPLSSVVSSIRGAASSASDMIFGGAEEKKPPTPSSLGLIDIKPLAAPDLPKIEPLATTHTKDTSPLLPPPEEKSSAPEKKKEQPFIIEDVLTIETAGHEAIRNFKRGIEINHRYINKFDTIMSSVSDEIDERAVNDLKQVTMDGEEIKQDIKAAMRNLEEALSGSKGPVAAQMRKDVEKAKAEYEKASAAAAVSDRYWPQVQEARRYFADELQAVFPGVDIGKKVIDPKGGNIDALLLIALRRVLIYQQMLARHDALLARRVESALSGTNEDLIRAKIAIELDKERRELALKYQKKEITAKLEAQKVLETELKKQLDLHMAHMQDRIDNHAKEVIKAEKRAADERVETQRMDHELKVAAILGRLRGVDEALKARSDADKMSRQSQKLWAACEALESALRRDTIEPMPLSRELDAIASVAADSDELVTAVIKSVPKTIRERGVYSELALRERFNKVDTACRRVALVPEEGAALPVYFLSWLQSIFLIKGTPIPKEELNDQPTDFSKLDTHDILERVRFWVDRCDWTQALRYIQLLNGAPSSVAKDWANEVILHLEARQAAKVLLAHASATGLVHL